MDSITSDAFKWSGEKKQIFIWFNFQQKQCDYFIKKSEVMLATFVWCQEKRNQKNEKNRK